MGATEPKRPQNPVRLHEMRGHIADVAAALFLDHGVARVDTPMIAAYASISESLVDYYFPDRSLLVRHLSQLVVECCLSVVGERASNPSAFAIPAGMPRSSAQARTELRDVLRVGQVFFDVMKTDRLSAFARESLPGDRTVAYDAPWIVANLPHFQTSESSGAGLRMGLRHTRETVLEGIRMRLTLRNPQSEAYDGLDKVLRAYLVALGASVDMADDYVTPALLSSRQLSSHTQHVLAMLP